MGDRITSLFEEHRQMLFGIAYRMLGSVADAQDMVQETYLRWQQVTDEAVRTPRAWLTTVITRLRQNNPTVGTTAGCYIGIISNNACQFVGGLGYLRFQIFHRSRDVEIAAADIAAEVEIERFFQFPGHVAVEISRRRRWFLCHAFATLY